MPIARSYWKSSKSSPKHPPGSSVSAPSPRDQVTIGKVVRAHGLRGAVVVAIDRSIRDSLRPGIAVELFRDDTRRTGRVSTVSEHSSGLLVRFEDVDDRTGAELLAGSLVRVARADLPDLGEGEYYDFEVIGWQVVAPDGRRLGTIVEVIDTGASDVYVIDGDDGEILVPVVSGIVLSLDRANARVVVEPDAAEYSGTSRSKP